MKIFTCSGGAIELPAVGSVLVDRADGGNLMVTPPRKVWERSELLPAELSAWSALVAATGKAMLDVLPQLDGGCINYWEAGNWSLHDDAEPHGRKMPREHRRVHLHLFGRSPNAADPSWQWGEAPRFPSYHDRKEWSRGFRRLEPRECAAIVSAVRARLMTSYGFPSSAFSSTQACASCGYPAPALPGERGARCTDCQ